MKHACWKILLAALVCLTLLAGCKKAEAVGPTAGATFVESAALFSDEEEGTLSPKAIAAQEEKEAAEKAAQETGGSGEEGEEDSGEGSQSRQTVRVTVPEGSTFMQIANTLEKKGVCTAADFYSTAQNYTVKSFTVPATSNRAFKMEGYLFPDTYEFYQGEDAESVLRKMLNNYAAKSGIPSEKTLILASIIERETRSTEQMKMVSSVFHNRLAAGMRLDSDPTREYVNNYITGNPLVANQSKFAPLYNTYKCKGLPAGPICNPGARAIAAAQNPSSSEYLYFFFGNDNQNHYSKTLEEHEAQMEQYGVQNG